VATWAVVAAERQGMVAVSVADVAAQPVRVGSDPTRWWGWVAVPAAGVAVRLVRAGGGWTRHGGGRAAVPVAGVTGLGGGSRVRVVEHEKRWAAAWRCVSKFDRDEMPRRQPHGIGFQQLLWASGCLTEVKKLPLGTLYLTEIHVTHRS
jgi:hypothetical protein